MFATGFAVPADSLLVVLPNSLALSAHEAEALCGLLRSSLRALRSQTNILKRLRLVVDSCVGRHLRCHYFCHYFPLSLLERLRMAAISPPTCALR